MAQILVVDDDADITALLCDYLKRYGLQTHAACDAVTMRQQLATQHIDLVVLDWMLPGADGLSLAHEIRAQSRLPIIMLSARAQWVDRVLGLESGADDYITKPFEPRELVARIQTVLRRVRLRPGDDVDTGRQLERSVKVEIDSAANHHDAHHDFMASNHIQFDGWVLHREARCLTSPTGVVVPLSNAEFRLLSTFLTMPRRLFSRDQLMEKARGRGMDSFERSIDLLVSRLRQKLADDPSEPSMIKTVRGAGYMFNVQSVQGQALQGWA